jgi:hypothetical protein
VLDNGKARFVTIKEGITNNGITEVFGDFKGDEMVMKNPNSEIKDGDVVSQ